MAPRYRFAVSTKAALLGGLTTLATPVGSDDAPVLPTSDDTPGAWYHQAAPWYRPADVSAPTWNPIALRMGSDEIYTEVTGLEHPLDQVVQIDDGKSAPAFADIDDDGDLDAFIGMGVAGFITDYAGTVLFYENVGTSLAPSFTQRTGTDNPLDFIDLGANNQGKPTPVMVDIDGDNDFDLFLGNSAGRILYFENTGDANTPAFIERGGNQNPLAPVNVSAYAAPTFADLDDDGDLDAVIGSGEGFNPAAIDYFENTGSAILPRFTNTATNPFDGIVPGTHLVPTFVDCDEDGDQDLFIGEFFDFGDGESDITFVENTGDAMNPAYVLRDASDNPLDAFKTGPDAFDHTPTFVDIDGDGDQDVFAGTGSGIIRFFRNDTDTPLPIELAGFGGVANGDVVQLSWSTLAEQNNQGFEVQHQAVGSLWQKLAFVSGAGSTLEGQAYHFQTPSLSPGTHRFRLQQLDFDGQVQLSPIVEVTVGVVATHELTAAYPNPFNPRSQFTLAVREPQQVRVSVFDVQGREMALLFDGRLEADSPRAFVVEAANWPSGLYFYEVRGERFRETRSLMLVK